MKKFRTTHTEISSKTPEHIWKHWSDIANWPNWDAGLSACKPLGDFTEGGKFLITPRGMPDPIEVTLIDVAPNQHFIDETILPFGKIKASHTLQDTPDGLKITHTIEAEIEADQAEFFEQTIWKGMEGGVKQSVRNLVSLAAKSN